MMTWPRIIAGVAIAAALVWLYHSIRQGGADAVVSAIERQNNVAADKADQSVLDYDACRDAGRVFDNGTLKCGGPAPGRRN